MANVTRKQVEDAIMAELSARLTTSYAVERYEGRAGDFEAMQKWIANIPSLPAIACFYAGNQPTPKNEKRTLVRRRLSYSLWLIHDKLRGYEEAMITDDGIYEMLEEIDAILQGNRLSERIAGLEPINILDDQLLGADFTNRMVWVVTLETSTINSFNG